MSVMKVMIVMKVIKKFGIGYLHFQESYRNFVNESRTILKKGTIWKQWH